MVMCEVLGTAGVQVKTPVTGSMAAPSGAPGSRLNRRIAAGKLSLALAVNLSWLPAVNSLLPMGASVGGFGSGLPLVMSSKPLVVLSAATIRFPLSVASAVGNDEKLPGAISWTSVVPAVVPSVF